jgi:excisionase family DNA binding protein
MFTVDQVAEILGISRDMVYDLLRTGRLRSIMIGHLRRISGQWVTEFAERTVTAGPQPGSGHRVLPGSGVCAENLVHISDQRG